MFENHNWEQIILAMKNSSRTNDEEVLESDTNDSNLDLVADEISEIVDEILNSSLDN